MVSEPKAVARRRKLRDALIHAAERTIAKGGLHGLKARELAYKVGCAVGAIYNVFTDLDDLIFAVNALTLEQLEKTLTVAGEKGADPQADAIRTLTHLALAYTDYAAANRPRWRALFDHRLAEGREVPAWYQANLPACSSTSRSRCGGLLPTSSRESASCSRVRYSLPCTASC